MENASKALIIAGAILLAILLISLGIMVFRQASGVVDSNAMDEVAVSSFNQKFEQYCGANIRGANVNALISTVNQNNNTYSDDVSKKITLYNGEKPASGTGGTAWSGKAKTGKSYKVESVADAKSGYITAIYIKEL